MINERWDWSYITMSCGEEKITLKVLHYECGGPYARSWYRVMMNGVVGKPQEAVINKCVGYGDNFEQALDKLIERRNGKFLLNHRT